jgi:hypothetical protein
MFSRMTAGLLAPPAGALQAGLPARRLRLLLRFLVASPAVDGRDAVGTGECRWKAVQALIFAWGALLLVGCTNNAAAICERLKECDLLPNKYSLVACENDVSRDLSEDQQADCSACLERKACKEAVEECTSDCAPR